MSDGGINPLRSVIRSPSAWQASLPISGSRMRTQSLRDRIQTWHRPHHSKRRLSAPFAVVEMVGFEPMTLGLFLRIQTQ